MPARLGDERALHAISTSRAQALSSLMVTVGPHAVPAVNCIPQIVSDRLALAGEHLRIGDRFLNHAEFRTSISRHYYSMYHAARALAFASTRGNDYGQHRDVRLHLPSALPNLTTLVNSLQDARFTRNEADYDLYPKSIYEWKTDASRVALNASQFVSECDEYAIRNLI